MGDFKVPFNVSRRDAIKMGAAALFSLTGCGSSPRFLGTKKSRQAIPTSGAGCDKATNVTRGPYFIDEKNDPNIPGDVVDSGIPMRSDIRSNSNGDGGAQSGIPLTLKIIIEAYSATACTPVNYAQVDIWQCNAQGVYSDITPPEAGPATNGGESTAGQNFLRGYQMTNAKGEVDFQTIFPGWYVGRAVHIHLKVRIFNPSGAVTTEATTQLFFDDNLTNVILLSNPAYQRPTMRDTLNANDMIYLSENPPLIANLTGNATSGYSATIKLGIQIDQVFGG